MQRIQEDNEFRQGRIGEGPSRREPRMLLHNVHRLRAVEIKTIKRDIARDSLHKRAL